MSEELREVLEEFRQIDDINLKSDLLIEYADSYKPVPSAVSDKPYPKECLVPGCESEVYVFFEGSGDNGASVYFAVENPQGISAMALAAILAETLNGKSSQEFADVSEELVYDLFGRNISMGKGQGLMNMVLATKACAKKHCNN